MFFLNNININIINITSHPSLPSSARAQDVQHGEKREAHETYARASRICLYIYSHNFFERLSRIRLLLLLLLLLVLQLVLLLLLTEYHDTYGIGGPAQLGRVFAMARQTGVSRVGVGGTTQLTTWTGRRIRSLSFSFSFFWNTITARWVYQLFFPPRIG